MQRTRPRVSGLLLSGVLCLLTVSAASAVQETPAEKPTEQSEDKPSAAKDKPVKQPAEKPTRPKDEPKDPPAANEPAEETKPDAADAKLQSLEEAVRQLTAEVKRLSDRDDKPAAGDAKKQPGDSKSDEPGTSEAQPSGMQIAPEWLDKMVWRELGPSNMGGRVVDVEVNRKDPSRWWIALGGAGLLQTSNHGTTVAHQFDGQDAASIGAVASDPTNPDVIWVGTGEANPRNSVSYGNGVYKSTDGGKTFEHVGLEETYQIGRILIDPKNPDTVYVGALGRLYGTNEERGVYKTTDGGKTWERVLFKDDRTGVIDMVMHPKHPETLIVAMWDRLRDGFDSWPGEVPRPEGVDGYDPVRKWGPDAGLYKTTDGGKNWKRLSKGLPPGMTGRIGLDWQSKSPHALYAIIDCEDIGKGPEPFPAFLGLVGVNRGGEAVVTQVMPKSPAAKAKLRPGDVLKQINGRDVQDFDELLDALREKRVKEKIALKLQRGGETVETKIELSARPGARTSNDAVMGIMGENGPSGGARLTAITDGGPSEKAGLLAEDVVTKVAGKPLKDYRGLVSAIRSRKPGDELKVTVLRGGREQDFTVTLGSRSGGGSGDRPYTYSYFGQRPNVQDMQGADGYKYGGVYKSTNGGESWERVNSLNTRPMYFSVIRVDPSDDQRVYVLGVSQSQSKDGGVTFTSDFGRGVHADAHDLWIDPADGRHMVIGCDGGFYVTNDRGANWDHVNTAAVGQFYDVTISDHKPYRVFGGLQDNGSWGGPGVSRHGGAINADWVSVGGGDGFVCRTDREDPDLVYSESQNGAISRRNLRTGEYAFIRPPREQGLSYRFNWRTPFELSRHNTRIFYTAGNYVWRSLDRGDDLQRISPEITLTKRGSATALSESPRDPDVLYVGSDDGALWVTRNGGKDWRNLTKSLPVETPMWVSTIEASRFADGRVYVCLDGHRSDSDAPHVFVSEDFGETFRPLGEGLPRGSTRALREDPLREDMLYLGTEWAFFVSLNRGRDWTRFNQDLPSVAVHEIAVHPEVDEIVLATHGRSLWACDVQPLRQLVASKAKAPRLLDPADVTRWRSSGRRGRTNRRFVGDNPSGSARLWYELASDAESVVVRVEDIGGEKVAELKGAKEAGLQGVNWTLRGRRDERGRFRPLLNGSYKLTLVVDGKDVPGSQVIEIQPDPTLPEDALSDAALEVLEQELGDLDAEEEEETGADASFD